MNKLSKLTALLLALVLALSVPLGAAAEAVEIQTLTEYEQVARDLVRRRIMAYRTYGEYWSFAKLIEETDFEAFYYNLPYDEQIAMAKYVNSLFWASLDGYAKVAPFINATEQVSAFSIMKRDGIATVDTSGTDSIVLNKSVSPQPDINGKYTITLESYVTGTVKIETETDVQPVDIMLVLDLSNSMTNEFGDPYVFVAEPNTSNTYYYRTNEGISKQAKYCSQCACWYDTSAGNKHNNHKNQEVKPAEDPENNSAFFEKVALETRMDALRNAVNIFIQNVYDNSPEDDTHTISMITYHANATSRTNNQFVAVTENSVGDLKITAQEIESWDNRGTNTPDALTMAVNQINNKVTADKAANVERDKVLVLFTDGKPGDTSAYDEFYEDYAARCVNAVKATKAAGTTVYAIAIFESANPTAGLKYYDASTKTVNIPEDAGSGSNVDETDHPAKIDAMMHGISSNYPQADASGTQNSHSTNLVINMGSINPAINTINPNQNFVDEGEDSYYLTAETPEQLNNIFHSISNNIQSSGTSINLGTSTSVQDVVTPYFDLPANASSVRVYTVDAVGFDDAGKPIWKTKQGSTTEEDLVSFDTATVKFGKTISTTGADGKTTYTFVEELSEGEKPDTVYVSNFDYTSHYVAAADHDDPWNPLSTFYGRKLVVEFEITPVDGFLGGNNVETNLGGSGIWSPDTQNNPVKDFENPDNVDVEVWKITVKGKHQHIFLSNEADMNALLQSFSLVYTKEGFPDETYEVNGIRNDYAKLIFTLKAKSNQAMRYVIEPGKTVGVWEYYDAAGNKIDDAASFDVTPFLTGDEDGVADGTTPYTISYEVIPKNKGTYKKTTGSLDVGVHVYKPTFTFQDTTEDYLAPATADGYYKKNNFVSESWSHTYYNEITVTINVTYDANGTPSYSYVVTSNKEGVDPIYSPAGWDLSQTIDFSGYGSTEGEKYKVTMSGPKPTVTFSYDRDEKDWITDGKVTEVECVKVNVNAVTLTSNNKHEKVEQGSDGAVSRGEYTSTSVYTEGSGSASVSIDGGTATTLPTGHITTKRVEVACTACGTTDDHVRTTNINSDAVYEFVVHIKNAFSELKIIKEGLSVGESAIFTVTGCVPNGTADGEQKTWTVVLTKTSADDPFVTITGLLVNSQATVAEDGNWSWRYKTTTYDPTSASVWIIPKTTTGYPATVTVSNGGRTDQWLSDEVAVKNDFSVNGSGTVID